MDISVLVAVTCLHLQGGQINPNHYNQFNPGIGLQIEEYSAGVYENSIRKLSVFGVYSPFHGWFKPFLGAVSGYKLPVMPAAGVVIEPWHKSGPFMTLTPADASGGIVFGLAWKQQIQ